MPKVSVIIPFNNVENYIEECLDSVLNQTLKDIEVILINDASTDNSYKIAKKYASQDDRIKILNIEKRNGQGFARNRGIEIAKGEYIGFVDSDDFIEPDMFECLFESASKNNTDISMCQAREYDDINEKYITSDYYSLSDLSSFSDSVFSAQDTKKYILDINVALWNKIYKREYLNRIGEKFPEGFIYEDLPFFFGTYLPASRIQIVWKVLYNYRINRKNSTMQQFNNKILDRLPMVSLTYEKLKSISYLKDMEQKIQSWIINDLFHRYTLLKEHYQKEFFFLMKKVFENLNIKNINDSYWQKVYHFQGYLLVINNSFDDFNQQVFNQYLDIHKVEDRLRSEMVNFEEIDKRFNLLYSDLDKNYKYTENLVNDLAIKSSKIIEETKNQITSDVNERISQTDENVVRSIENATKETDNKISTVYDEITKNYKYTENLVNDLTIKSSKIIEETKNQITIDINERISQTDENVVRSIENTNKKIENIDEKNKYLYSDIKDLSFIVNDNFIELNKENETIKEQNKELNEKIYLLEKNNNDKILIFQKENKEYTSKKIQELKDNIKETDNKIFDIKQETENEKQNNQKIISELKSEFIFLLEQQQKRHEEEVLQLKNQLEQTKIMLREEMKPPIKKLIEKYQHKTEK